MSIFLFLLPLILLPAFDESIPGYDDLYSPILTDKSVYSWTDKIKITIISPSWNSDKYSIDSIGDVDSHLIKVATSKNSGSFIATISTSQNSLSSGNRLYALSGDEIFAKYNDHTLPKPFSKFDHLKIDSSAKVDSSIPYVERLKISPPTFSDRVGSNLELFSSNS